MAKRPKIASKIKLNNPILLAVLIAVIAAGIYFVYKSFAASYTFRQSEHNECYSRVIASGTSDRTCAKFLQRDLEAIADFNGSHPFDPKRYDGTFNTSTKNAVKAYQRGKGLTADGVVGRNTWSAIAGSCRYYESHLKYRPGSLLHISCYSQYDRPSY